MAALAGAVDLGHALVMAHMDLPSLEDPALQPALLEEVVAAAHKGKVGPASHGFWGGQPGREGEQGLGGGSGDGRRGGVQPSRRPSVSCHGGVRACCSSQVPTRLAPCWHG